MFISLVIGEQSEELDTLLTEGGVQIDEPIEDEYGGTALHTAAFENATDTIKVLLKHGAQTERLDDFDSTPLQAALSGRCSQAAKLLIEQGAKVDSAASGTYPPIVYACEENLTAIAKLLLERDANPDVHFGAEGNTPLLQAIKKGQDSLTNLLLAYKADPNIGDFADRTPLHLAAFQGDEQTIKKLHAAGGELEAQDVHRQVPLHYALCGKYPILSTVALISLGANPRSQDSSGHTPLHFATLLGHEAAVRLLLSRGANAETVDAGGNTPLHLAADYGHDRIISLLAGRMQYIDCRNDAGETALMRSVQRGHNLVNFFARLGANVNAYDKEGNSILDHAIVAKQKDTTRSLKALGACRLKYNPPAPRCKNYYFVS